MPGQILWWKTRLKFHMDFKGSRYTAVDNNTTEHSNKSTETLLKDRPHERDLISCPNGRITGYLPWVLPKKVTFRHTVYPKKYAHGFVVLCFVVVMQSFIMHSHEVLIHIHQRCFAGTGAIVRLPQCHWSKPDGYGKISQCITTTKHSKAKTVWIFLGIYCIHM